MAGLLAALESRPTSDVQLIWSWYGAGKTHTLYYLANQCAYGHMRLLPMYVELPREAKSFVDLYRVTISQFSIERLIDAHLDYLTRPVSRAVFARSLDPDLNSALTQATVGERPIQVLLQQWLLGNSLPAAAHRELGVGGRINTTEKCATILADVVSLLAPRGSSPGFDPTSVQRVIWIVDEVQRVEELGLSSQRSILSGLVGVFNRCPTGLTLILSYTGTPREKSLPEWIPPDLADRIGLERPMLLPPLRSDEAKVFVRDLLEHFRLPECIDLAEFYPFEPEAIEDLIKALGRQDELKPRAIMETLDVSLRILEPQIRAGKIKSIGVQALRESLARLPLNWTDGSAKKKERTRDK
ncbi:MAG: hypothetical protein ACRD2L_14670 [Terriglobia bacterium]